MTYKIFHGPGVVHFIEGDSTVVSGQPNQETFESEANAIYRILELNDDFFPQWDRNALYMEGQRVKFGNRVYRALQENQTGDFQLPDLTLNAAAEIPTPRNRKARWAEVYEPPFELNEEESNGRPVQ